MAEYILYQNSNNIEKIGDNVCLRFYSDAQRFVLKYSVSDIVNGNFPHVGVTAREGLAILFREYNENCKDNFYWKSLDLYNKNSEISVNMSHVIQKGKKFEIIIYGPILSTLNKMSIILEDDKYFQLNNTKYQKKLLVIGGRKTFGIGVTSTSMMFSNILKRNYCIQVDRVSSHGNNFLKDIAESLKEIEISNYDAVICEIDELGQSESIVKAYLEKMLHEISAAKKVILWHAIDDNAWKKRHETEAVINRSLYKYSNFSYLNLNFLFSPQYVDICTYSIKFINDAGNILIYSSISKELEALSWSI